MVSYKGNSSSREKVTGITSKVTIAAAAAARFVIPRMPASVASLPLK
jgi:hypothetical protein